MTLRARVGALLGRGKSAPRVTRVETLRALGVKVGQRCAIYGGHYDSNFPFLIEIGDDCILTFDVIVLAHDAAPAVQTKMCRVGKVRILDRCFIGQRAIILPGVTIGPDSIVGAGSVVTKDVPPRTVVAGSPARQVATLDEYLAKLKDEPGRRLLDYTMRPSEDPGAAAALHAGQKRVQDLAAQGYFDSHR